MRQKRERRRFTREFKLEAVRQVVGEGRTQKAVAEELGVNANLLGRWIKQLRADPEQAFPGQGDLKDRDKEFEDLRRESSRSERIEGPTQPAKSPTGCSSPCRPSRTTSTASTGNWTSATASSWSTGSAARGPDE